MLLDVVWTRRAESQLQHIFSKLDRRLGLFYVVEGRRLIVSGIFPLTMNPSSILLRLEDDDWM